MQKDPSERHEPEAECIEPRKGHVARSDLERQNVIHDTKKHWHGDEKNHRGAMHGEQPVVRVRANQRVVRHGQLQPNNKRFQAGEDEKHEACHHV